MLATSEHLKARKFLILSMVDFMSIWKFHTQLSWARKKFYNLGAWPGMLAWDKMWHGDGWYGMVNRFIAALFTSNTDICWTALKKLFQDSSSLTPILYCTPKRLFYKQRSPRCWAIQLLTLCILATTIWVLWQSVKIQIKWCITQHFIPVCTIC